MTEELWKEIYLIAKIGLTVSAFISMLIGFIWKWFMKPSIFNKVDLKMKAFAETQKELNDKAYANKEKFVILQTDLKHHKEDLNEWKDVVKSIK